MTSPAQPYPDAPILFFDSGIGGVSVLQPTLALLPRAPIVYGCDYAGLPYGEKSEAEVATRVSALLGRLVERVRPRLAVIACNTASTIALAHVRAALDIPFVGTVPAIRPAAAMTRTRVIGVLGTAATVRQPYVEQMSADFAADCRVIRHGAPDLVVAAEAKLSGRTPDAQVIAAAVAALRCQPDGERIDVIVLACTHFPLIADELQTAWQANGSAAVALVAGGAGIARRIVHLTAGQSWPDIPLRSVIINGSIGAIDASWPTFTHMGFTGVTTV